MPAPESSSTALVNKSKNEILLPYQTALSLPSQRTINVKFSHSHLYAHHTQNSAALDERANTKHHPLQPLPLTDHKKDRATQELSISSTARQKRARARIITRRTPVLVPRQGWCDCDGDLHGS
jgi:hypothetical protein